MKAILCMGRGVGGLHIHSPGVKEWAVCACGNTAAKWEEEPGKIVVATRASRADVRGLGLNNQLLVRAIEAHGQAWETYREWHDIATDAPGYIFDKSRANCWAVVFIIGTTSDSRWATDQEFLDCFTPL